MTPLSFHHCFYLEGKVKCGNAPQCTGTHTVKTHQHSRELCSRVIIRFQSGPQDQSHQVFNLTSLALALCL